jgi:D-sedoheptulose 7-phosphate isomerase
MSKNYINHSIKEHLETATFINEEEIQSAIVLLLKAINSSKTIFWCGNGGSASQANHLSAELIGGMYKEKIKPFKSICLNVDTAFITAWSNDKDFHNIFTRQLEALCEPGDVLVGLSTSGNSKNVLHASKFAKSNSLKVISLTGNNGGELKQFSDVNINVSSDSTQRIQEMHILIGHILCDIIEKNL